MRKNFAGNRSLMKYVMHPYQGFFIYFGYSGRLSYNKDANFQPSGCVDIEGLNEESAWILIYDAQTKMIHGNCCKKLHLLNIWNLIFKHIIQIIQTSLFFSIKMRNCIIIQIFKIYFKIKLCELLYWG